MSQENYNKFVEKIAKSSGMSVDEVVEKINAKRSKLSGLISDEGAAQIIAAELGISFDNERLKIDDLMPGMRKANFVGKVTNLFPVRTFTRNDQENKVANFIVADDTSNIKVVLWDTNHIALIENGEVDLGTVVEIVNGGVRDNEVHLGSFSELKLSDEVLDNVLTQRVVKEKSISDFKVGDSSSVRAFVVGAFDPKFFNVCLECKKKVTLDEGAYVCAEHGKVSSEKRALINIAIDDGTENIRAVLFHENLALLGLTEFDNAEMLIQQKQNMFGKELIFEGNIKMNSYSNSPEMVVNSVKEVNLDELMGKLEV